MEKKVKFFCSWSGGKDACLALYRAIKQGMEPAILLTMMIESGERSRSHGLSRDILRKQGESLGIAHTVENVSWQNYEEEFIKAIKIFKSQGIEVGVFGDIDLEDHKSWVDRVCTVADVQPSHPLWKAPRRKILEEFIGLGFKATIVSVKDGVLDKSFLGRVLDMNLIREIEATGVDACGEEGEFHTVVTDGPIFQWPIQLEVKEQIFHEGYWFQNLELLP